MRLKLEEAEGRKACYLLTHSGYISIMPVSAYLNPRSPVSILVMLVFRCDTK